MSDQDHVGPSSLAILEALGSQWGSQSTGWAWRERWHHTPLAQTPVGTHLLFAMPGRQFPSLWRMDSGGMEISSPPYLRPRTQPSEEA